MTGDDGRAYVFLGGETGLELAATLMTPDSPRPYPYMGDAVGSAGDVNGDGYADIVVGASGIDRAYVYLGSPLGVAETPTTVLTGPDVPANFGHTVGSAGDTNGDGYADVIVADSGLNASRAYVYLGGSNGIAPTASLTFVVVVNPTGAFHPLTFGGGGSFDGDAFADVVIGAPYDDFAQIYSGSPTGLSTSPTLVLTPSGSCGFSFCGFGFSVASLAPLRNSRRVRL
jgi:hypothetical protein